MRYEVRDSKGVIYMSSTDYRECVDYVHGFAVNYGSEPLSIHPVPTSFEELTVR